MAILIAINTVYKSFGVDDDLNLFRKLKSILFGDRSF